MICSIAVFSRLISTSAINVSINL